METVKFDVGNIVMTMNLSNFMDEHSVGMSAILEILNRHRSGDYGDTCAEDARTNNAAIKNGSRIVSLFRIDGEDIFVITDAATDGCYDCFIGDPACMSCHGEPLPEPVRQVTTILLASDY